MFRLQDIQSSPIPGSTNSFDGLTFEIYFLQLLHLHQYILTAAPDPTNESHYIITLHYMIILI
jgi:hypothetical protein